MKTNAMMLALQGCLGLQGFRGALLRLSMTLLLVMLTVTTAWADDSGTCGDNLKWEFTSSDSTLTISGTGDMDDYDPGKDPWRHYISKINKIILPEGLSKIGSWAFYNAGNLKELTIPASVTQINEYAFTYVGLDNGCTLTFAQGSKLSSIEKEAFKSFKGNVDLHECTNLTTIGKYVFASGYLLKKITIPASVEIIDDYAFQDVGSELDNGCTLTFAQGSKLSSIGNYAFKRFKGDIDWLECTSLTTIGQYAFSGAVNLEKITIPASVERFESYAFQNVGSKLGKGCTLTMAQGSQLKYPKANAFNGFKGDIDLRECTSLTIIHKNTFEGYQAGTLRLPVSLSIIEKDAFINSKPSKVYVAYKNCVLYVNDKYRSVNPDTKYVGANIKSNLRITANGSKKLDFTRVSFDDIAISFDEQDTTYVISQKQGLIDLGDKLAEELQSFRLKGQKVKLAADLDFTNMPLDCEITSNQRGNFMPIDIYLSSIYFSFDGQGHTIKGLKFSGEENVGLFSTITTNSIVKNVTLIAPNFSGTNSIGGIAGNNNGGSITNCSVIAPSISGDSHLGGIAGKNEKGTISECNVIDPSISGTGSFIGCVIGGGKIPVRCDFDVSTGLDIYGEDVDVPFLDARLAKNRPLLHLNLDYGITSTKAITIRNYTMGELYDKIWLYANRAGYELVNYKSEEVTIEDNSFQMPQKNVSVTAVWEPMNDIIFKGSLNEGVNWSTFYCGDAGYRINEEENACAYTATLGDDEITLHQLGKVIPKGTAVIIASENNDISMTRDDVSAAEYKVENDLNGVDLPTARTSLTNNDAQTLFMLSNKNDHFGFHKFGGANVPARKAYFTVSTSTDARSFSMVFEDESTRIVSTTDRTDQSDKADAWYTLDGRKLQGKPTQKGLYIENGHKVVIK
ncbi:leucine-rich repeat domain-containing protein [Prevotella sp. E15-22]|uniref:leucine-rich repeat domain-containing protein n=1 Tax=Prevotella sp. E15-22 TaxID=2937774 RepID=UPI00205D4352|nr:leucine-rich repeat domain-containing protein [Prevotella sp. E15-22]UPS45439.1 leucine-rich repeat domain-containing protein [Prevotella sp. E15-22]